MDWRRYRAVCAEWPLWLRQPQTAKSDNQNPQRIHYCIMRGIKNEYKQKYWNHLKQGNTRSSQKSKCNCRKIYVIKCRAVNARLAHFVRVQVVQTILKKFWMTLQTWNKNSKTVHKSERFFFLFLELLQFIHKFW